MKTEKEGVGEQTKVLPGMIEGQSDFLLTEEERRRYLMLQKITYFTIPLLYLILTLIFH